MGTLPYWPGTAVVQDAPRESVVPDGEADVVAVESGVLDMMSSVSVSDVLVPGVAGWDSSKVEAISSGGTKSKSYREVGVLGVGEVQLRTRLKKVW